MLRISVRSFIFISERYLSPFKGARCGSLVILLAPQNERLSKYFKPDIKLTSSNLLLLSISKFFRLGIFLSRSVLCKPCTSKNSIVGMGWSKSVCKSLTFIFFKDCKRDSSWCCFLVRGSSRLIFSNWGQACKGARLIFLS